jgi:hypothetical protein
VSASQRHWAPFDTLRPGQRDQPAPPCAVTHHRSPSRHRTPSSPLSDAHASPRGTHGAVARPASVLPPRAAAAAAAVAPVTVAAATALAETALPYPEYREVACWRPMLSPFSPGFLSAAWVSPYTPLSRVSAARVHRRHALSPRCIHQCQVRRHVRTVQRQPPAPLHFSPPRLQLAPRPTVSRCFFQEKLFLN